MNSNSWVFFKRCNLTSNIAQTFPYRLSEGGRSEETPSLRLAALRNTHGEGRCSWVTPPTGSFCPGFPCLLLDTGYGSWRRGFLLNKAASSSFSKLPVCSCTGVGKTCLKPSAHELCSYTFKISSYLFLFLFFSLLLFKNNNCWIIIIHHGGIHCYTLLHAYTIPT